MASKPRLPDGYELPGEVNGWRHDPESNRNGHVWTSDEHEVSVAVFNSLSRIRVAVFDDRVDGFANKVEPYREAIPEAVGHDGEPDLVADGVEAAVDWMQDHAPAEWEHPAVNDAVFDPPAGYVLDRYYLEEREHIVYYRQEDSESAVKMAGGRVSDSEPSLETRKYLYISTWRGSGNSTIALAPWLRPHDHEMHEVVEPPEECGLDVAVLLAREWVAEQRGLDVDDGVQVGQSSLEGWSA